MNLLIDPIYKSIHLDKKFSEGNRSNEVIVQYKQFNLSTMIAECFCENLIYIFEHKNYSSISKSNI